MKKFEHSFEDAKEVKNPQVVIREQVDREALPMNDSPLKPDEALENIGDEQAHADYFENKYQQQHQSEFRTPEGLTEEQAYDPTEELDEKIDADMKEKTKEDLEEIQGPEGEFPQSRFIPKDAWEKLSPQERKKVYEEREAGKQLAESYVKHPVKRFVRKMFGNKKEAA